MRRLAALCTDALRIDLSYEKPREGTPMTWNAQFDKAESGGWSVLFDFASTGEVSFQCSELEVTDVRDESPGAS